MASLTTSAHELKAKLSQQADPLQTMLDERIIHQLCDVVGHSWRYCFWRPAIVMLTFLRQVLTKDGSCRQAVAMTLATTSPTTKQHVPGEEHDPSSDPSAYSQARQRLPVDLYRAVSSHVLQHVQTPQRRWRGHRVHVVDGSSVQMPDTEELQQRFPQPTGQRPGCGFPVARIVAVFCWASGALVELVVDSLKVSELTLFRQLTHRFSPGDVVVGDRFYGAYYDFATLAQRGVHGLFRKRKGPLTDLRRGQRLGKADHLVVWRRPQSRAWGVTPEQWNTIPEALTLRHVRVTTLCQRGFRQRQIELFTTLLDPVGYPPDVVAELYRDRWMAELNLRSLKTTLGMEVLRCKSVEMIHKELAMHQIAYNLIRVLMDHAAVTFDGDPHRLSFAGTQQRILCVLPVLDICRTRASQHRLVRHLLGSIASDLLPHRPNRNEPRAVKRRPKSYPYLTHPRDEARRTPSHDKR